MLEYIYFVKCPGCEDEHFDFFNEAKDFAMSLLSKKPIITQIEVDRNDFGECTDSCDLGTVWSWEDVINSEPSEAEPTALKKDTLCKYDIDNDPEFQDNDTDFDEAFKYDSLRDKEYDDALDSTDRPLPEYRYALDPKTGKYTSVLVNRDQFTDAELKKLESCKRKHALEGMTLEQLVETMQENEDTVECAGCEELFPKDECYYKEDIGYLCRDCEDRIVKCTWCEELYDKSECRKEVNLGWVCPNCEAAIKSRGEKLTFIENDYFDFLDEDYSDSKPLDKDTVDTELDALIIDEEEAIDGYNKAVGVIDDTNISDNKKIEIDNTLNHIKSEEEEHIEELEGLKDLLSESDTNFTESFNGKDIVDFHYDDLDVILQGPMRDVDDWDEAEDKVSYTFSKTKDDVAVDIWENFIEEKDARDVEGGLDTLEDDKAWYDFLDAHFDELLDKYYDKLLEYYRDDARAEYEETHSLKDNKSFLEELEEPEAYRNRLTVCPECGVEESFDHETGICINCGFNL